MQWDDEGGQGRERCITALWNDSVGQPWGCRMMAYLKLKCAVFLSGDLALFPGAHPCHRGRSEHGEPLLKATAA